MIARGKDKSLFSRIKKITHRSFLKLSQLTSESDSTAIRGSKGAQSSNGMTSEQFFETVEGAQFLRGLLLTVVFVFGLKGKIGAPTLALFFNTLSLQSYVPASESTLGRLKVLMMQALIIYSKELQPKLIKLSHGIEIIAGADETFFERLMIMLFMDLSSGFILLEEHGEDRKAQTWGSKTELLTQGRFKRVLCLVTDRGRSLIKWAKDIEIKSIADFFHIQQVLVKLFRYSFESKRRSLRKQEKETINLLDQLVASNAEHDLIDEQRKKIEEQKEQHIIINKGQKIYQAQLLHISKTIHPFNQTSNPEQSSTILEVLKVSATTLRQLASDQNIEDPRGHLNYFEKNINDLSPLIDLWWKWVDADLERYTEDKALRIWIQEQLLPVEYWKEQVKKSRSSPILRDHYRMLQEQAEKRLKANQSTDKYLSARNRAWAKEWVLKFQRSSSQVEGRNGCLTKIHQSLRGISELQLKTDTVLHNFQITRSDNTTACERLYKFKPPDLCEWLINYMPELGRPRKYKDNREFCSSENSKNLVPC